MTAPFSDDIIAAARVAVSIEAGILAERQRCARHLRKRMGDLGINGRRAAIEIELILKATLADIEEGTP